MKLRTGPGQRKHRGIALIATLFIVVVLLLVAAAVLSNSSYSANDALNVAMKNQTFNAAEAGINVAQWELDQASGSTTGSGSVDGFTYNWSILSNNLQGSAATAPINTPPQGSMQVPPGTALLQSYASALLGGRTVYVYALVQKGPPTILTPGAIVCGGDAVISHQQIIDTSGKDLANIDCGQITASGGGQVPQGKSLATGTVNQITGYDGKAYTNQPPPTFYTAAELANIRGNTLKYAQSGAPNFYTSGDVTGGTIGTSGSNCYAYIGGSITLKGNTSLVNYCTTTVVMGDVTISGTASYQTLPAGVTHMTFVFGTNGTTLNGTPTTVGIFYVANANVTINGGGNGSFTGSVYTPNNVTMNGGGTSNFYYNPLQTPPPLPSTIVQPVAQWEY